ncbi:MAG: L-threonylcarbamoyladenylate synthase [Qingshengfaniella sp.]
MNRPPAPHQTERLADDAAGIARAAALLRGGGTVAFPTETVYGLGADATNDRAVAAIFTAKNRPRFNPLIAHLADSAEAGRYAHLSPLAEAAIATFWPGPLTLILPLRDGSGLSPLVTAGADSVALRVPGPGLARRLLAETGRPVAAPSANPSGRISPTTAAHVLAGLDGRIDAVLAGGACQVGVESTILDLTDPAQPVILRPGAITAPDITQTLGHTPTRSETAEDSAPKAPGQMSSHYAPRAPVRLHAHSAGPGELLVGFGPTPGAHANLSESGDLVEAAASLFSLLHDLDKMGPTAIAFAPIPDHGLGRAINDRLRRAAAPRPQARPAVGDRESGSIPSP